MTEKQRVGESLSDPRKDTAPLPKIGFIHIKAERLSSEFDKIEGDQLAQKFWQ